MKDFAWVLLYKGWDTLEVSSLIQFISCCLKQLWMTKECLILR